MTDFNIYNYVDNKHFAPPPLYPKGEVAAIFSDIRNDSGLFALVERRNNGQE